MAEDASAVSRSAPRELVLTRVFDAPRSLVFEAWTDPKRMAQWWGPKGFTNPVCELDVRPGGAILIHMRAPDGVVYPMSGVFREVVAPERLVFTSAALDDAGKPLFQVLNTVTFSELAGGTALTVHARVVDETAGAEQYLSGMSEGWNMSFDRLATAVAIPRDRELWITRTFDAPRELVFKAWTEPEHARHWFAPEGCTVESVTMDVRPGGAWRSCMRWPDGSDHWQGGVFREIVPPERLVFTYAWEDADGRPKHETLVTVRLVERAGKTELTFHQAAFESESSRDSHAGGWNSTLTLLGEHLAKERTDA